MDGGAVLVIGPLMLAKHLGPRINAGGPLVLFSGVAAFKGRHDGRGDHQRRRRHAHALAGRRARADPGQCHLPGVIDSGAWDGLGEQAKADYFRQMADRNPAGRIGTTDEIASAALFAMTNTFLTGVTLSVDGGETLTRQRRTIMGLAWQQGPLGATVGRFLTPEPIPERLLFAEPPRRRMRVKLGGEWIADSEDVILLHEPGRYPVAYFPLESVRSEVLERLSTVTTHRDLGSTAWFTVTAGGKTAKRGAWQHTGLPAYASELTGRVAFAWRAMDAFFEEDERIVGHAADPYHRVDIRRTSRHLVVRVGDRVVADTTNPVVLYESGFAPRWYVPRADIDGSALTLVAGETFCPYKGLASYYSVAGVDRGAWSYVDAWPEAGRVRDLVSFEPDLVTVTLDNQVLHLEPGQLVTPHGIDRDLTVDQVPTA
ncbi:SDR family oxidoreductase [Fodinicola acaciae]|uniref:SDR family oxidoreductase n=1 Tax=Fodinicola acaciae TaxID=2681555 RepID=UPI001C9E9238|nr:SDR family oxidoreductase [Fodinicola acaciae]